MKILLIGPAYPLRGGMAQFLAVLYGALEKAGHEVVCHRFIRQYPKFLFPGKTQADESAVPIKVPSIPSLDPMNPLNWPLAALRIAREKPDLVILEWWIPFFGPSYTVMLWLARKFYPRMKVMYLCHNAVPHEKRPGDMVFTRAAFSVSDLFIVMSETVKRDLLSIRPDAKLALTPHPIYDVFGENIDKETAKRALGVSGPVILFFGFVRPYKGLMVLLDAMPDILKKKDLTLIVAGEFYDDKDAYIEKIKALGLTEKVVVLDRYIPNEAVGAYFSAADLLVLPYLSATQSGITQIACAFGTPVVATKVGGLPEVVKDGETGYLVPPGDKDALAAAVIRYYEEGKEAAFKEHIKSELHRFSWAVMVEAIERLFQGKRSG